MTTLTKTTLPFAAVALLAATSASQAAVVNVDIQGTQFGNVGPGIADYTGGLANGPIASDNTWNYFNVGTTVPNGQSLSAGGLTFTFGTGWQGSFADGAPNNLQGDRVFAPTGFAATMTISGLDITKNYNIALIGASLNTGGFETDFTIGATTKTATAAPISGTGNGALTFVEGDSHVLFSGISGGTGSITFSVTDSVDPDSANGVLSGLQIEEVPEPSTTALLGLGGLALIFRRRK
ncbi:MAG: PEP-CTERM sorting domain-containing protein [Akkermansiaceae bacterium]